MRSLSSSAERYQDERLRRVMNMSQPTGPRNMTITNQPIRGLNGQRDSAGMRHGPAVALNATCTNGKTKPNSNTAHANDADKIRLLICFREAGIGFS